MKDFLDNEFNIGDKVIAVIGTHLRHCIIEDIIIKDGYHPRIKYKGLKKEYGYSQVRIIKI